MRVHFQNTLDDYRALLRAFPLRKRLEWILMFPLWLVAVSLPGTVLLMVLGDWYALVASWLILGAFLGWIIRSVRHSWRTLDPKALAPASIWFDEESVSSESGYGWSRRDWSMIHDVREPGGHVLLFTTEAEAFAIPLRAFASSAEAEEFASGARLAFARSREPGYVAFAPPLPAEVVAEGFVGIFSALQVRYQNTAEELATIQFRGLVNADPFLEEGCGVVLARGHRRLRTLAHLPAKRGGAMGGGPGRVVPGFCLAVRGGIAVVASMAGVESETPHRPAPLDAPGAHHHTARSLGPCRALRARPQLVGGRRDRREPSFRGALSHQAAVSGGCSKIGLCVSPRRRAVRTIGQTMEVGGGRCSNE